MNTSKIIDFAKRNAVVIAIIIVVILAFTYALPHQIKLGGEISVKNSEIMQADSHNDLSLVKELKIAKSKLESEHILWTVLLMVIFIPFAWAMLMILSGLSLYCYTNIPFLKAFSQGADGEFSDSERLAFMQVVAYIPIANALLIIAVFIGIFFVFFS